MREILLRKHTKQIETPLMNNRKDKRKNCIDQKMKNQSQGIKGYHKPEIDMPPLPKIRPKNASTSHARMYLLFLQKKEIRTVHLPCDRDIACVLYSATLPFH